MYHGYTPPKKYPDTLPISSIKRLFWNGNLKMIPSEYRNVIYLILKVLNRPFKWDTLRLWTSTGLKNTSRRSWTLKKPLVLVVKQRFFSNVQLWRLLEADPVGVQRRTVRHFKDLFKIFKMTYSMSLYSDGIIFKFRFQKCRFTAKTP